MKKRIKLSLQQRKALSGYMFITPWLIGIIVFVAWPFYQSLLFAFHNVLMLPTGRQLEFVGLQNFVDIWIRDMYFITRLIAFFTATVFRVPVIVVVALLIAILINQKIRFKGVFRTIFFLPVIIVSGPVINELIAQDVTSIPLLDSAQIYYFLGSFLPDWLIEPIAGLFDEIILILWFSGVQILIFLAALQKVNPSLYEAAKIDGGSGWECFWKITLPTIKPIILVNLVYTLVTLANSDMNDVITLIMLNVFSGDRGYGFATAMAWMYTLIISLMLFVIFLCFREREDKRIKNIRKQNHKELKKLRRTKRGVQRNQFKIDRKLKKGSKNQGSY